MSLPTWTVEVGFGQYATTAQGSVTWTDVTAYARAVFSCERGRAEAGVTPSAGQMSLVLDNSDARFTPGRSDGPYGEIRTRFPVRVLADAGSGDRAVWAGFITDWSWSTNGADTSARLEAADVIATAARIDCVDWHTAKHVNASADLSAYWPLDDPQGADEARAVTGSPAQLGFKGAGGDLAFGVESELSNEQTVAAFTPTSNSAVYLTGSAAASASGDFAVSAWVYPTDNTYRDLLRVQTLAGTAVLIVSRVDGGIYVNEDGYASFQTSSDAVPLNKWTHIFVQRDQSESGHEDRVQVYINGAQGNPASNQSADASTTSTTLTAGQALRVVIGTFSGVPYSPWSGQLAHVALWADDTDVAAAVAGLAEQDAAARFADLPNLTNPARLSGWISADTDADIPMSRQEPGGVRMFELAEQVALTEGGDLIVTGAGKLHLQSSRARLNQTAALTVSAASDVLDIGDAFSIDNSDEVGTAHVVNNPSGVSATATRASEPGVETQQVDIWSGYDPQAQALAEAVVSGDRVGPRSPQLRLSMNKAADAGNADDILQLELGDLITVTNLPSTAPATSLDLIVESISHDVSGSAWTVTLDTSPAPSAGWVLGTSVLGTTTKVKV